MTEAADPFAEEIAALRAELAFKRTIYTVTIDRVSCALLEELLRRADAGDAAFGWWLATRSIASPYRHMRNEAERQWEAGWANFDRTRRTSIVP